jgi:hypothetical protein
MKAKFDLLLIEHSGEPLESIMGLKVENTWLPVKNMTRKPNSTDFETLSSMPKKLKKHRGRSGVSLVIENNQ